MIKATIGTLYAANNAVGGGASPLGHLMSIRLPVAKARARLLLFEAVEQELQRYEKLRLEVLTPLAGGAKQITPDHPKYEEANQQIKNLLDLEVELRFDPIKYADLGEAELSPYDLRALKFLFTD